MMPKIVLIICTVIILKDIKASSYSIVASQNRQKYSVTDGPNETIT